MANHFAHLFIRDPLVIFSERINQDNNLEMIILKIFKVQIGKPYDLNLQHYILKILI